MAINGLCVPNGRNPVVKLIYGHDEAVANWVAGQIKHPPYPSGMYRAIGIMLDNSIIGGVIWHNYHEDFSGRPLLIEVTIATIDKRWCSGHNLRELFAYPFIQLGVKRVQATCHRKAKHVRITLDRLGFHFEGIVREAHPLGGDAAHYSLLKQECKWLNHGKKRSKLSSTARSSGNVCSANTIQQRNGAI